MWLVLIALGLLVAIAVISYRRPWGSGYDALIAPPNDLRRADDGGSRGLAERDGTGGFL